MHTPELGCVISGSGGAPTARIKTIIEVLLAKIAILPLRDSNRPL